MPRQAGKYGRQPFDRSRPHLTLERYLDPRTSLSRAGLPPVALTAEVDRATKVPSWPMFCNDTLGCCTIAGLGHMFNAWTAYAAGTELQIADAEILRAYSAVGGYDPNAGPPGDNPTDQGCQMQDVLAYAKKHGIADATGKMHKVAGFAAFGNPVDEMLLGQVLDVFGTVYTGFNVQQAIEEQFSEGKPWTYHPGEPYVGGHCVVLQKRDPVKQKAGFLNYVTWGAMTEATAGWLTHTVEECWAVVTQDWLTANGTSIEGMALTKLLADMEYV
jgi:hypothetical protein